MWVEGIGKVDVYTPKVKKIDKILTAIEKKNKQTTAVLTQIDLSAKDMQQIANRTWGKPSTNNINTLFFQNSIGWIYRYDRPNKGGK